MYFHCPDNSANFKAVAFCTWMHLDGKDTFDMGKTYRILVKVENTLGNESVDAIFQTRKHGSV